MSKVYEIERKFLILNFSHEMIPKDRTETKIVQRYLKIDEEVEIRIRSKRVNGKSQYFYTEKKPTGEFGKRYEREVEISFLRYFWYSLGAFLSDLVRSASRPLPILKTRYTFKYQELTFEVDIYECPVWSLVILEVELKSIDDLITFPPRWMVREVTNDPRYKNANIACGSLNSQNNF